MAATHTYGTTFSFNAAISQVKSISVPGVTVSAIDITHLASSNAAREFMAGLIDAGSISFELVGTKAQFATLYGLLRTTAAFTITLPDASTFTGSGFITSLSIDGEEDDAVMYSCEIKITGKPTFTA